MFDVIIIIGTMSIIVCDQTDGQWMEKKTFSSDWNMTGREKKTRNTNFCKQNKWYHLNLATTYFYFTFIHLIIIIIIMATIISIIIGHE